jgi:AraC family transcriptional regulator
MTKAPSKNPAPTCTQPGEHSVLPRRTRMPAPAAKPSALQVWRLQRVVVYIETHLADQVTLLDLSREAGFSPMHFASQFRTATGLRPHDYLLRRKVEESQILLLTTAMPIVDIALNFGFLSQAHFTTVFKRIVGSPPLRWQHSRRRQIQSAVFRLRKLKAGEISDLPSDAILYDNH